MKKIIFSIILLILILLVFRNKIEFFTSYPDSAMKIHDKWINETVNYIRNERNNITHCLDMLKELLNLENLNQFINNIRDNDLNEIITNNNLIVSKINLLLPRVNLNERRLLNILKRYLTCNINYYQSVNNISSATTPANIATNSPTSMATIPTSITTSPTTEATTTPTSEATNTTSVNVETFTSNQVQNECDSFIDEITEHTQFDNTTGQLVNIRKPLFIELVSNYIMIQDIDSVIDVLYNIYDEKYIKHLPQYNNNIEKMPCLIYDKSSCPIDRCQLSDINNENTICHPKYTQNNPSDISARVDSCSVLTPYGEKYCEATKDKFGDSCVFDHVRNKCMRNHEASQSVKCEDINAHSADSFETKCNSLQNPDGSQKCTYKGIVNNGKTYNYCYDRNNENNSSNLCYAFSGLDTEQIPSELNCNIVHTDNNISNANYYSIPSDKNAFDHDNTDICHLFDNSDTMEGNIRKNQDQKINIDSLELQKKLCEGLIDRNGNQRCKFIEHNTFVSNDKNDQLLKSKLTKCIKNNVVVDGNYIKGDDKNELLKKAECIRDPNNVWSENNKMCINKNSKCGDLKYENLCNYKKNCHWTSIGPHNVDQADHFERGYCNDIKTKELERIIDIIHRKEIDKLVKINEIKTNISKFNSQIKSQEFLDKWHKNK